MEKSLLPVKSDVWILPHDYKRQAPYYFDQDDRLWFEDEADTIFAIRCIDSLIALGIGKKTCPQISEWALFVLSGSITKTLSGKLPAIPFIRFTTCGWHTQANLENYLWEILYCSVQKRLEESGSGLDRNFLASMLKFFLPRYRSDDMDSEIASHFVDYWNRIQAFWGSSFSSTATLHPDYVESSQKSFQYLPPKTRNSIRAVASHVPGMLQLINPFVRNKYSY